MCSSKEYVVLTLGTTGMHPASSRIVYIDAFVCSNDAIVQEFHQVIHPGRGVSLGPRHMHGLTPADVARGKPFSHVVKKLSALLRDRTLVLHDAPSTWGFIVAEARRRRVMPAPAQIVDTLESAYRKGFYVNDVRPAAVAQAVGIPAPSAVASQERARESAFAVARQNTELVWALYKALGPVAVRTPRQLAAEKTGLQRSRSRVRAAELRPRAENPGVFSGELRPGMIFAVAPEVSEDPNVLIDAGVSAGLRYVEKLTRDTSLVVCNKTTELTGKAMHAQRKSIPLLSDAQFLALI